MPKIQTDFTISGEKQYKQAISEINAGLGVLDSEMKKVTAQYQDNADSVEALTAKGDVLERKLLSQREKVEQLREALAHAVEQYGEGSKTAMEYQKSLNNAEAAEADLEHAIRENNKALEEAEKGMGETGNASTGLSGKIQDLATQFGSNLPGGLGKALGSMKNFSAGSVSAVGAVVAVVTALVKAYKQLFDMTKEAGARADEILTLSQITGLSTETIQEMKYASNLIDVSFETIKSSLSKLKNAMQDARDGNKKYSESFETLGVSIYEADGSLRSAEEVFYDLIDALGEVQNATERDAMTMDIFGRKAEDLNPLILQGSDRLRELADEAHNVNYIMSSETLQALGEVDDAYQRLGMTQEGLRNQLSGQMAPAVEEVHKIWADFTKEGGELLVHSGIVKGMGELLETVTMLIEPLTFIMKMITPATEELGPLYTVIHGIGMTIAWILDTLQAAVGFLTYLSPTGRELWNTALGRNAPYGQYSHMQRLDGTADEYEEWRQHSNYDPSTGLWSGNYGGGNATGNMHWVGGRTTVGENGPEEVELPEGARIWNAQDTRRGAGSVYIDKVIVDASSVKEFNDIVRIVEDLPVVRRMG